MRPSTGTAPLLPEGERIDLSTRVEELDSKGVLAVALSLLSTIVGAPQRPRIRGDRHTHLRDIRREAGLQWLSVVEKTFTAPPAQPNPQ